ncbi:Encoded by [Rhizoctonia solani]|uniref:Encoded by n=1 Tax=Rhizoctonia solani TaxID=456999 RepID=A0A8H7I2A3_9AGAM|nr:Encoded by [Rhizoctonia solani]
MSSTPPRNKWGRFDFWVSKIKKHPRSNAETPDPTPSSRNATQTSNALGGTSRMQSTTPVPHDMSTTPPPTIEDSVTGGLTPPSLHEQASFVGPRTPDFQKNTADRPRFQHVGAALKGLCQSAGVFPPLQAIITDVISCFETLEIDSTYETEYEALLLELQTLSDSLAYHVPRSNSAHMSDCITRMKKSIAKQTEVIKKRRDQPLERNLEKAEQYRQEVLRAYRGIESAFRQLQTDATMDIWSSVGEQTANSRLHQLFPSRLAPHNSTLSTEVDRRACTKHTRTQILLELDQWSADPQKPNVYWMNGMAGTGKTTIAYTFAESLKRRGLLGASFFCTRASSECQDVGQIIPTITYQLARYSMSFQSAVVKVLGSDPDIGTRAIAEQCEQLIKEPLAQVKDVIPGGLVVVIDALDECNNANGVRTILDVLFRITPNLPLKFFITSRPEPIIRHRIEALSDLNRSMCVLHEIEKWMVEADIELYLREELDDSVSDQNLSQLAKLSGNLFIYAATAIRYIRPTGTIVDPDRLETILISSTNSGFQHSDINELYTTILEAAVHQSGRDSQEQQQMRLILWTAVCTREPVNIDTLAALTGIKATKVNTLLQSLYSVLHVSRATSMITTLHASFPDFMFGEARSSKFYCDEAKHSQLLAKQCFQVMEAQLRFNICSLETSFIPDREVQDLEDRITSAEWTERVPISATAILDGGAKPEAYAGQRDEHAVGAQAMDGGKVEDISSDLSKLLNDFVDLRVKVCCRICFRSRHRIYTSRHWHFAITQVSVHKQYWGRTRGLLSLKGSAMEQSQTPLLAAWSIRSGALSLAFSPDGILSQRTVACLWLCDKTILVRDAQTGTCIYDAIKGHEGGVTSALFSPDGKHILSGSWDQTTRMWDSGDSSLIPNSIKHHPDEINCTAFSPDGKHVACGLWSNKSPIIVYNASTSESLPFSFAAHRTSVESIAFSPHGKHLVTGHRSGDLRVWSLQDGTPTHSPPTVHSNTITSIRFSPLGDKLVTASYDRCVYIWDVENGYSNPCLLGTHDDWVFSAVFSPDGTRVASCSHDRTLKMWNAFHSTSSHTSRWTAPTKAVYSVAISPDGSRIAAAGGDKAIYMFNTRDGTAALEPLVAHTGEIHSVVFSGNGRYLVSGSNDKRMCLWDTASGKLLSNPVAGHENFICSVSFSPDSRQVVSASWDKTIRMWHVDDGALTPTDLVGTHDSRVNSAVFSPDGARIVSGCDDRKIRMWDSQTLSLLFDLFRSQQHEERIWSVTFSSDGKLIASGSDDGTIFIFDSHSGEMVLGPLKAHQDSVRSVLFSPDGNHIVSGSADRRVGVWRVEDGAPACEPLEGHQSGISSMACSPEGAYIVSGSWDSTIRVWKVLGRGVVSNSSQSASSTSDQREPHRAIAGGLKIDSDGWARNRSSQLLFWVPSHLHFLFPSLKTVHYIGPEGTLQMDYSNPLLLGDEWYRCFVG